MHALPCFYMVIYANKINVDIHFILEIYAKFRHGEVENKTAKNGL